MSIKTPFSLRKIAIVILLSLPGALLAQTFTVTNTNDSGPGSLRQAIEDANLYTGYASIEFAISGLGPYKIELESNLDTLTNLDGIKIDGLSQLESAVGTGDQTIIIDGKLINGDTLDYALYRSLPIGFGPVNLTSNDTITNLEISFFKTGMRLIGPKTYLYKNYTHDCINAYVLGINSAKISNNYISSCDQGFLMGTPCGIYQCSSSDVIIEENFLNDIQGSCLSLGFNTGGFNISGNYFGTDTSGAMNNQIGTAITSSYPMSNLLIENNIIGNAQRGLSISANNATIRNNSLGIHPNGNKIPIVNAAISITAYPGTLTIDSNLIGNSDDAILITADADLEINNNYIGVDFFDINHPCSGLGISVKPIGTTIDHLNIKSNVISNVDSAGISYYLQNSGPNNPTGKIADNHIYNVSGYGIVGQSMSTNYSITDNTIGLSITGDTSGVTKTGLFLNSNNNNKIINNKIYYAGGKGIDLISCFSTSVRKNYIYSSGDVGIKYVNCSGSSIDSNGVINGKKTAIDISASSGCNINANSLTNNGKIAIVIANGSSGNRIISNSVIGHDSLGVACFNGAQGNKISQNSIINSNKGIDLKLSTGSPGNNAKDTATITSHIIAGNILTLSGTGTDGDTIEIFTNNGLAENATSYVGHAKVAGGVWSLNIPEGSGFDPAKTNFYVTTATDLGGNTSELSMPYAVQGPCGVVSSLADSGPGTLRAAIECANAGTVDTITFDLGSNGIADTIFVSSVFPVINNTVVIDGSSDVDYLGPRPSVWVTETKAANITGYFFTLNSQNTVIKAIGLNGASGLQVVGGVDSVHIILNELINFSSGIQINANSEHTTIEKNILSVYGSESSTQGIQINGDYAKISGNFIGNLSWYAMNIGGDSCIVSNNTLGRDLGGNGVLHDGGGWMEISGDRNIFSENIVTNVPGKCVGVTGSLNLISANYFGFKENIDLVEPQYGVLVEGIFGTDNFVLQNKVENISNSGVFINNAALVRHKISKNVFSEIGSGPITPTSNKAIMLGNSANNSKDTATITSYNLTPSILTLSGTSVADDSVEVFINDGTPQNALEYVGTAKTDATGNWSLGINRSQFFTEGQLNYYVTTATDLAGNTSELSAPFVVFPEYCTVINTNDAGTGSLREAMTCASLKPGPDTIVFNIPGTAEHVINIASPLEVILNDTLIIDGNSQPFGEVVLDGSLLSSPTGFNFQNTAQSGVLDIDFKNFGTSIILQTCNDCIVDSCQFLNAQSGVNGFSNSLRPVVTNNYFKKITRNGAVNFAGGVKHGTVTGNTIDSSGSFAIQVVFNCDSNFIANNILNQGTGMGFKLCCSVENTFSNNLVQGFAQGGIDFNGGVINNQIIENAILDNDVFGVRITGGGLRDTLVGNTIGGTTGTGIIIEAGSKYNYIEGNYIGLNASFDSLGISSNGIQTSAGCNKNIISNNYIGNCGSEGIRNSTDSTIITNNFIGGDGANSFPNIGNGIRLNSPSQYLTISDNHIQENAGAGIFVQYFGTIGNRFARNKFVNNGGEAIDMNVQTNGNAGNNKKNTAYITSVDKNGNNYTLTIEAEPTDVLVEIFEGDSSRKNALSFITDDLTNLGNGVWEATINTSKPNAQFTVTSTAADSSTSALGFYIEDCFVVYTTADAGLGSLREAIECANIAPDTNTITFAIPGNGPHEIVLSSQLPSITSSLIIDASNLSSPITIKGNGFQDGLFFETNANYNAIKNLTIEGFNNGVSTRQYVEKLLLRSVSLTNNSIGLNTFADSTFLNKVYIHDNTTRGINADGESIVADSCSILNNGSYGIYKSYSLSYLILKNSIISGNGDEGLRLVRMDYFEIDNCKIGVDSSGRFKKPNQGHGIFTSFSGSGIISNSIIGGNEGGGVYDNDRVPLIIYGNYIGTNKFGDDLGNNGDGIYASVSSLRIGGTTSDSSNIIGFNNGHGIWLRNGGTTIINNFIGVDPTGRNIHNFLSGINGSNSLIIEKNSIGNNFENGIVLGSGTNKLINNFIGTGPNDENWGNVLYGIDISAGNQVSQNKVGYNGLSGIHSTSSFNWVTKSTFQNNGGKAISWDVPRDTATITNQSITNYILTLSGEGPDGDSVEVFLSDGQAENALRYVNTALISGGTWSMDIPDDGINFWPLRDDYYVTTSTNNAQTSTSELSQPFLVPVYLCEIDELGLLPEKLGICKNDSIFIESPVENVIFRWFKDGSLYSNAAGFYTKTKGEYVLELEDRYGCKTHDTIQVVENPQPLVADYLVSSYTDIDDELVIVDVSYTQPDSISWDFGGANYESQGLYYILTFPDTGSYDITLTSYLGYCVKSRVKTIRVLEDYESPGEDLRASFDFKTVQLFPNPTTGLFTAEITLSQKKDVAITLFDTQSNIVLESQLQGQSTYNTSFDIQSVTAGTYFMRFTTDTDTRIIRIVKQ